MNGFQTTVHVLYLVSAVCFIRGLHQMTSPGSARRGNVVSAAGMTIAVATTLTVLAHDRVITMTGTAALAAGLIVGGAAGLLAARRVHMTAMPQLVSVFNAAGGGAAVLVAFSDAIPHLGSTDLSSKPVSNTLTTVLVVLIGGITLAGSLVAGGKLAGVLPGRPLSATIGRVLNLALAVAALTAGAFYISGSGGITALAISSIAAVGVGLLSTLPIGGADMPVVISLLNAFTGTAVAMAGFVIDSNPLIIGGALVGAAGAILTQLMASAMNRSIISVVMGGFGTGDDHQAAPGAATGAIREITADDAALQLAYAATVVIVPGYGLAAAQGQHEIVELANALTAHGVEVSYGIHPVAGRMPGHMNVLLAEANAPYEQLKDLEEINPVFPTTDVVLVVGANDVTNPAARRPGNAVSGMPILDVDQAKSIIVIKRSLGHGYAGIDNELFQNPRTAMLFGDAKAVLTELLTDLHSYTH